MGCPQKAGNLFISFPTVKSKAWINNCFRRPLSWNDSEKERNWFPLYSNSILKNFLQTFSFLSMDQTVRLGFQLGFALWGLFLCGSFLYTGKQVLGILGFSSAPDGPGMTGVNEKGITTESPKRLHYPFQFLYT